MTRFLGQVPVRSPILTPIPTFPVELRNGRTIERVRVGFDSGMDEAHLEIPTPLATKLGIARTGFEGLADPLGNHIISVGRVQEIRILVGASCAVKDAKVLFFDGAPMLVGSDFMRAVGAWIAYGDGGPVLHCDGGVPAGQRGLSIFPIFVENRGRRFEVDALFDTGWETSDLVVAPAMARRMGLEVLGQEVADTPSGSYTAPVAMVDRVGLRSSPGCEIVGAKVKIRRAEAPFGGITFVGGSFMQKVRANVGFGKDGPFLECGTGSA